MTTLEDMLNEDDSSTDKEIQKLTMDDVPEEEDSFNILAPSKNDSLDTYNNHPLVEAITSVSDDTELKKAAQQFIRGLEGITGKDTQLALMDCISGVLRAVKTFNGGE